MGQISTQGLIQEGELIPQDHAQGIPDNYQTEHATPDTFGANIGQAMEKAGNEAAQTTSFYQQVAADHATNQLLDLDTKIKYGDPSVQGDTGIMGMKGASAMSAYPGAVKKWDDGVAAIRQNLSSPYEQQQFDQMSRRYRAYSVSGMAQHADQQQTQWAGEVNKASSDINLNAISKAATDPNGSQLIPFYTNQLADARVKDAMAHGAQAGDAVVQDAAVSAHRDALKAQVLAMAATPQGADQAQKLLESHKDIAGTDYAPLMQHVRSQASQYQVDQGVAAAVDQAHTEVNNGTAPKGMSTHGGPYITGADGKTYATDQNGAVVQPASFTGSAPAASGPAPAINPQGRGLNNGVYNLPLDRKGVSGLSAADSFQFLRSHGASTNEALVLTGAGANESSFNAGAWHDNQQGYGMYGHNLGRLNLVGLSPQQQMIEALNELRHRPEGAAVNAAKSPEGLALAEMHYERPAGYSDAHPENGDNFMGRLNTIKYFSQMANGTFTGSNGAPVSGKLVAGPGGKMLMGTGLSGMDMMWTPQALQSVQPPPTAPEIQVGAPAPELTPAPAQAGAPTPQPAAYPVMETSPAGMTQMAGQMNAMSVAARAMQIWGSRTDVTPEQRESGFTKLRQNLSQAQFAADATQQQVKEQSNQAAKGYIPRIISGDATALRDISRDPNLEFPVQKELVQMAREWGAAQAEGMGPGYNDMLKRAALPQGDPNRISNYSQLLQMRNNGDISDQGLTKGASVLENLKKQDFQGVITAKSAVLDQVKNYLSYGEEGNLPGALKDPKGQAANDKFVVAFESDFDQWVQAGKNPFDFLKDEKGIRALADSIRSPEQKRRDKISEQGDNSVANAPITPETGATTPPPNGIDPETWTTAVAAAPPIAGRSDGAKWPASQWGDFVKGIVEAQPEVAAARIMAFNKRYPSVDLQGLVNNLRPARAAPAAAPAEIQLPQFDINGAQPGQPQPGMAVSP